MARKSVEYQFGPLQVFDLSLLEQKSLSSDVCMLLNQPEGEVEVVKFADSETDIDVKKSVRGVDAFVFQSYTAPLGERLHELYLFLDAVKQGGHAQRVTPVMPHLFGCRGERRVRPRQSVPALVVARNLKSNGANGILTIGEHTPALGSLYNALDLGYEDMGLEYVAANCIINNNDSENVAVVSPDVGGGARAEDTSDIVQEVTGQHVELVIGRKKRKIRNTVDRLELIGSVKGKDVWIIDDIGDTIGTIVAAGKACRDGGAKSVRAILYHPVLGKGYEGNLHETISGDSPLVDNLFFFDTIPLKKEAAEHPKVVLMPTAPLTAEAIKRMNTNTSISSLYRYDPVMRLYEQAHSVDPSYKGNPKYLRIGRKDVLSI